jgi:hypothetical protein
MAIGRYLGPQGLYRTLVIKKRIIMKRHVLLVLFIFCLSACNVEKSTIVDLYLKNQKVSEAKAEFNRYLKGEFLQSEWKKLLVNKENMIKNDFLNENVIKDVDFQFIPTYKIFSKKIVEYKNLRDFFKNLEPDTVSARCHLSYNGKVVGKAFLLNINEKWHVTDLLSFTNAIADYWNNEKEDIFFIGVKNQGVLYSHCFYFEDDKCYCINTDNGEKVEFTKFLNTKYGSILQMGIDKLSE